VPPIVDRRSDLPDAFVAVLDVALSPDPANRYASATEFAHALWQVMKHAPGVDLASALGAAVLDARNKLDGTRDPMPADSLVPTKPRHDIDIKFSDVDTMPGPGFPKPKG
jgi:hypothetical protein